MMTSQLFGTFILMLLVAGACKPRSKTAAIIGDSDERTPVLSQQFDTLVGVIGNCSAFRSGRDEVTTASHCLPADDTQGPLTFRDRGGKKLALKGVIRTIAGADWVTLSVGEGGSYFKKSSFDANASVSIISANPTSAGDFLRQVKTCHLDPFGKGLFMHDCDTEAGASGSPILQGGGVIGMHLGFLASEQRNIGVFADAIETADVTAVEFIPEKSACGSDEGWKNKFYKSTLVSDYFPNRTIGGAAFELAYAPGSAICALSGSAYLGRGCQAHDLCYVTAGTTKKKCDTDLHDAWVKACVDHYSYMNPCYDLCQRVVRKMWKEQRAHKGSREAWIAARKTIATPEYIPVKKSKKRLPFDGRIIAIKQSDTGTNSTEVHIVAQKDKKGQYLLQKGTVMPETGSEYKYMAYDYNRDGVIDIVAIKRTATGVAEIHILNGKTNYRNYLLQKATGLTGIGKNWTFDVFDYNHDKVMDLIAIKMATSAGQLTEVHVLNGASVFQHFIEHETTALGVTAQGWDFSVFDINRDRAMDVVAIKRDAPHTEIHVLNGATKWKNFLVQKATLLERTDATWRFFPYFYNNDAIVDLVGIKKSSTGTNRTEIHVLDGKRDWKKFLLQSATILPETGSNWQFDFY